MGEKAVFLPKEFLFRIFTGTSKPQNYHYEKENEL